MSLSASSRKELSLELRQDGLDGISHLHAYDRDRLSFKTLKLAERYRERKFEPSLMKWSAIACA